MELQTFTKEDTTTYIIQPHPSRSKGLRVGFRNDGLVALWMIEEENICFCISPEAAIQLVLLIDAHIDPRKFLTEKEDAESL